LNLVKHFIKPIKPMSEPLVSSDILAKPVFVRLVKIIIPFDTFQQHLPKSFFQLEVGEMEIDETLVQIKVQNLCITK